MTLIELNNKRSVITDQIEAVINKGKAETRKLDETEEKKITELRAVIEDIDKQIKDITEADKRNAEVQTENKNITIIKRNMNDKKFSFYRAINAVVGQKNFQDSELRAMEIGNRAFMSNGLNIQGQIVLPMSTNRAYADLFGLGETERRTVLAAASNAAVKTDVFDLLAPLYSRNPLLQAGSQVIFASSNISFPSQSAISIDYVNGENIEESAVTPTNSTALTLAPKYIRGFVDISKTLLVQENPANEAIIMNSIVNAINKAIITAALGKHSHVTYKPDGFFTGLAVSAFTVTSGATAAKVNSMIAAVDSSDALEGSLSFFLHPQLAYILKAVPAFSTATVPILNGQDLGGYKYYTTSAMPKNLATATNEYGIVFGDWSKYIQAWFGSTPESLGALSILVDPYTRASFNAVRLHINLAQDMGVLRSASFAKGSMK
jgi:HK97 family phage major capsid protein